MWKPLLVAPALEFRGWTWREVLYSLEGGALLLGVLYSLECPTPWREVLYSLEYSTPWREALHWRLVEE